MLPILCMGKYANHPLKIEKIGKRVFSIEELCYCIAGNAYLLDEDFFNRDLANWINDELGLHKLADEVESLIAHDCSSSAIAGTIMDYVGYNPKSEIEKTESIIRESSGKDIYTKAFLRANFQLESGNLADALNEYDFLLETAKGLSEGQRADIYHNEGVIYAGMFMYEKAADLFTKAYEINQNDETFLELLAAKRLSLPEQEYLKFVSDSDICNDKKHSRDLLLKLEQRMEEARGLFDAGDDNHNLATMNVYRQEGKMTEYRELLDTLTATIRHEYRRSVRQSHRTMA